MMTRRGLALQEESKLRLALKELKASKELCAQLTLEREDNERELLEVLEANKKLKAELSLIFQQNNTLQDECDLLKNQLHKLDSYGLEYESALKRISNLEKELYEANQHIIKLEEASHQKSETITQDLFKDLVCNNSLSKSKSNSSTENKNISRCSIKKLKKYIKINKFINKTQKLLKKHKIVLDNNKLMKENIKLKTNIDIHLIELENSRIMYEFDTQQLQKEILELQNISDSMVSKLQESQSMVFKYSAAMEDLIKISTYAAQCFESRNSTQSVQVSSVCSDNNKNSINTINNNNISMSKLTNVMYCDQIGQQMSQFLNKGQNLINSCYPNATFKYIIKNIVLQSSCKTDNLVIFIGNRGNLNKKELINYYEKLCSLSTKNLIMFTFPYSKNFTQQENNIRHILNQTLHTFTVYNNNFTLIDTNRYISCNNNFLTKDRYNLPLYFKRQIADSLSYFLFITAKNLARQPASIEQVLVSKTLEDIPRNIISNLN